MTLAFEHLPLTDSILSRLDPRWKLAALLLAAAVAAVLHSLAPAILALAGALLLAGLGRLPRRWLLARLGLVLLVVAPFALVLPFVLGDREPTWQWGTLRLSLPGLLLAVLLCCKALTITTLLLVLLVTAPLPTTLQAAQALHVPGLLTQLTMLTYRYLFVLADELARLRVALRVRGYRNRATLHCYRTVGHVAGTLLVRGYERAERVGQALRCRGFDGRFRTLTEFRTRPADVVACALIGGAAVALLLWDRLSI
jgi:cobalt/nickel transport system permease protein